MLSTVDLARSIRRRAAQLPLGQPVGRLRVPGEHVAAHLPPETAQRQEGRSQLIAIGRIRLDLPASFVQERVDLAPGLLQFGTAGVVRPLARERVVSHSQHVVHRHRLVVDRVQDLPHGRQGQVPYLHQGADQAEAMHMGVAVLGV